MLSVITRYGATMAYVLNSLWRKRTLLIYMRLYLLSSCEAVTVCHRILVERLTPFGGKAKGRDGFVSADASIYLPMKMRIARTRELEKMRQTHHTQLKLAICFFVWQNNQNELASADDGDQPDRPTSSSNMPKSLSVDDDVSSNVALEYQESKKETSLPTAGHQYLGRDGFHVPSLVKETKDKIKKGTLQVDQGTDAITLVLGKEKGGYARGVGSGVRYKRYFDLPRSKQAADERILLLQSQLDAVRRERQEKELLIHSMSSKMSQTEGLVTKLKTQLAAQGGQLQSMPTQLTPPAVSPVKIHPINSSADEEGGTTVVRCDQNDASIRKEMQKRETVKSVGAKKTTRSIRKDSSSQDSQSKENVSVLPQAIKCKLWHLKKTTIIAEGTVYKSDGKIMLHNKALPKDCYKVSIDKSLVDAAFIPDVGSNGCTTVLDAVGGFVAWPKNQVVLDPKATPPSTIQMITGENKTAPKVQTKRKNVYVSSDAMQKEAKMRISQKALDLLQVVFLSALAWMDYHELVLEDDSWSIDSRIGDVVKYSSYKGLNSKSSSCSDGASVSLGGETFGTSFELEGSLLMIRDGVTYVAIASAQKNKESLKAESIVRAASTRVRFRLLTTPFCYPTYTITQDNQNRVLNLRRREEKSLVYNPLFLDEYECSSLALDRRRNKIEDEI
ncbi:hypothetical protein Tco_0448505 [Tanacetum coccineum]